MEVTTSNSTDPILGEAEIYMHFAPNIINLSRFFPIPFYILGITGNVLSFMIWIQRRMLHSSGVYLAALALNDLIFLILKIIYEAHFSYNQQILDTPGMCQLFPIFFMWTQHTSVLLVLAFTIERYLAVCHPFIREKFCNTTVAVRACCVIACFTLVLNAIQGYFFYYEPALKVCTIRSSVFKGGDRSAFFHIWTWTSEILLFLIVPLAVLVLNIMVIQVARNLSEAERRMLNTRNGRKTATTTFMLLGVSFLLICTTLPVTVVYAMYVMYPKGPHKSTYQEVAEDPMWRQHITYMVVKIIVQNIGLAHFACNFYIYCITGKMFRKELALIFKRLSRKHEIMRRNSSGNTSFRSMTFRTPPVLCNKVSDQSLKNGHSNGKSVAEGCTRQSGMSTATCTTPL